LLLRSAGSRYRSIAAAATQHVGRVNFDPTVRMSSILVPVSFLNMPAIRTSRLEG